MALGKVSYAGSGAGNSNPAPTILKIKSLVTIPNTVVGPGRACTPPFATPSHDHSNPQQWHFCFRGTHSTEEGKERWEEGGNNKEGVDSRNRKKSKRGDEHGCRHRFSPRALHHSGVARRMRVHFAYLVFWILILASFRSFILVTSIV